VHRVPRFLTVKLDKYGIKYNEDKRNGLIGKTTKTKSETAAAKEESKTTYRVAKDDLTLIEGVGPKAAAKLSGATPAEISDILSKGGPAFQGMKTGTWPQQGQLAADGKWSELNALKARIEGGVEVVSSEEE